MAISHEESWEQKFSLLKMFIAEHQRLPKNSEEYCGIKIRRWCSTQKSLAKSSKLSPDRLERLSDIGLIVDIIQ